MKWREMSESTKLRRFCERMCSLRRPSGSLLCWMSSMRPILLVTNEMCVSSLTISSSCLPFSSGIGHLASSALFFHLFAAVQCGAMQCVMRVVVQRERKEREGTNSRMPLALMMRRNSATTDGDTQSCLRMIDSRR